MTTAPNYSPGHDAHWIQAKLAAQDPESWEDGHLQSVTKTAVTVEFSDGPVRSYRAIGERVLANVADGSIPPPGEACRVGVSERWHLMAVGSPGDAAPRSRFGDASHKNDDVRPLPTSFTTLPPPLPSSMRPDPSLSTNDRALRSSRGSGRTPSR